MKDLARKIAILGTMALSTGLLVGSGAAAALPPSFDCSPSVDLDDFLSCSLDYAVALKAWVDETLADVCAGVSRVVFLDHDPIGTSEQVGSSRYILVVDPFLYGDYGVFEAVGSYSSGEHEYVMTGSSNGCT